jgi:NodT family efflux transporter outer membrane factor (OMF) lipoprotein
MLRVTINTHYHKWLIHLGLICAVMAMFAGCITVGPDYQKPTTSLTPAWNSQLKSGLTAEEIDPKTLGVWWTTFNDPELSGLIDRAVAGNLDLKKARARVREARAQRGVAGASLFPTLDVAGSAVWIRTDKNTGSDRSSELYSGSFDAGWELDIFGGIRRSVEEAEADLQASQEDLHDVLVSLLAEVALNYVELRSLQAQIAATEANLETQSDAFKLATWRQQAGLSDDLAVQQARYNLENTRSLIPALRTSLEEALNRIAVLLGKQPGKIHGELTMRKSIPATPLKIAVGVPADVIRHRPDVRRVERELAAQTARVGVATANLYPKFTLSGSIGLEAVALGNLSSGISSLLGSPRITWPIFSGGSIRQNIEIQSARQEQAMIKYEATVLSTIEEVENIITAYAEQQVRRDSLRLAEEAASQAAELAQKKYEAGLTDFMGVLEAQRSLLSFQEQLARSEGAVVSNLIRLYKALGGGWESLESKNQS